MLLLEKEQNLSAGSARKIMVISQRETVRQSIGELLRVNGIDYVDEIDSDFFSDSKLTFSPEEVLGVILDIQDVQSQRVQSIVTSIYGLIPQNIWCCVVGNSDSISVAQQFLEQGIIYFHLDSQMDQMVKQVSGGISTSNVRTSVNIHILGCKGGVGASLISCHIADLIAEKKKVPVLLSQYEYGTPDLDLLFGKRLMQNTMVEYDENLRLLLGDVTKFKDDTLKRFNFIVHDAPIFNRKKEDYATLLDQGSNFVLIIERKLSSIRIAKQFLDEYKRVQAANPKPRRVFVCINDHRAELSRLMADSDIERLLENPVDVILPHIRKTEDKVLDTQFSKAGKEAMNDLVMSLLGITSRHKKKQSQSLFMSIYRQLVNK